MNRSMLALGVLAAAGAMAPAAAADVTTFYFTDPGTTYTGFIFPGDPRVGGEVTLARIYLYLEVFDGADAADFDTDLTLPIDPADGASPLIAINGAQQNWSGSGIFEYELETTLHNGVFLQTLYGAASSPLDAVLLEGSRVELVYTPVPGPGALALALPAAAMAARRRR